jgi:hypothetical protein
VFISPYGLCPRLKNEELRPEDRKWGQIVEIEEDKKSEKGIVDDHVYIEYYLHSQGSLFQVAQPLYKSLRSLRLRA